MSNATLSPGKRRIFRIIFILLPFLAAEAWVRHAHRHVDLLGLTGRTYGKNTRHPMADWAMVDAFCAYRAIAGDYLGNGDKTVDSAGFISTPEVSLAKPTNTLRIVFLGESSTAGTGKNLPDKETWPWKVAERVRRDYPAKNVEFINGALGGYTSFESYGRLWSRIRFYSPDIVVVCHGWNEMYYFKKTDDIIHWRTLTDGSWTFDRTTSPMAVYRPRAIDRLIWPSQLLVMLRLRFFAEKAGEVGVAADDIFHVHTKELSPTYDKRGLDIWRTNVRLLRDTASTLGVKLFVCKQATLVVDNLPEKERQRCDYVNHGFTHDAHVDAFREIYKVIDEEIPSNSVIDLTPLSGRPELFQDHVHPTPEGTTQFANIVASNIVAYLNTGK